MAPQLTRLMIIFGMLILVFLLLRWIAKPDSFYWYGHYRGEALAEVADQPVHFASISSCFECHDQEASLKSQGVHASLSCQTCHGPGDAHVQNPLAENIDRPDSESICLLCHRVNRARPSSFPQVDPMEHAEGMACTDCHLTHNPGEFQ